MGTQFEDIALGGMDDFFSLTKTTMSPSSGTGHEDENRLIQDGNAQLLKNVEAQKKKGDYSRTQTTRVTREPSLNMNLVDWSGFSGAAHLNQHPAGERKSERRSSLHGDKGTTSRKVGSKSPDGSNGDMSREFARSLSPKSSPVTRNKYRSRRRLSKSSCLVPLAVDPDDGNDGEPKEQMPLSTVPKARAERRSSGSNILRNSLRSSTHASNHNGKPRSQSKNRTRRPQTAAQRRSLSPSTGLRTRNHSVSPTGRLRRPVAAAASSTTLEVSKHTTNRQRTLRSNSRGKRKKDTKPATDIDEGHLFQKASSFRW